MALITNSILVVSGYFLFLTRAKVLVFIVATYCIFSVYTRAGWTGIFLSANLAMLSNDLLTGFLQGYENVSETKPHEESDKSDPQADDFTENCNFPSSESQPEGVDSPKSCQTSNIENACKKEKNVPLIQSIKPEMSSLEEMKRIMGSLNHYETLGIPKISCVDLSALKKEYRRKVR